MTYQIKNVKWIIAELELILNNNQKMLLKTLIKLFD